MQLNHLIFEFDYCNDFDTFKIFIFFLKNLLNLRFISNFIFIKFIDLFNRFTLFTQNSNQFKKLIFRKTLNFKSNNSFFFI